MLSWLRVDFAPRNAAVRAALTSSIVLAGLAAGAVAGTAATARPVDESSDSTSATMAAGELYEVRLDPTSSLGRALHEARQRASDLPSTVGGALPGARRGAGGGSGPAANAALGSRAVTAELIESQGFEGNFPPDGWQTQDRDAGMRGRETYTWGTQDCDLHPRSLGMAAAWSVGGGEAGDALLCGANYGDMAHSWLLRTGIDTRPYPGGIQVNFKLKLDVPRPEAFQICASTEDPATIACSRPTDTTPRWFDGFETPLRFPRSAGLADAALVFIYLDASPTGGNTGAYIDDLVIEGVVEDAPPTVPAPSESPVPTPDATATRTPSGTAEPRDGRTALLPLAVSGFGLDELPHPLPTAERGRLMVEFGTQVTEDGTVVGRGSRFAFGITTLCAKQSWEDLPVGTVLRRQWSGDLGSGFEPLGDSELNNAQPVRGESGYVAQCIGYVNPDGGTVPIPVGRYRVELFVGDAEVPSAAAVAAVESDAATTEPPPPTPGTPPAPTVTPTEEPEPTPGGCTDPIENGDFESGPGVGWTESTAAAGGLIRTERPHPSGGTYSALFGTVPGVQELLTANRRIRNLGPDELDAVSLRFDLLMITDETAGAGEETDLLAVCLGGDSPSDIKCVARASEDTWPPAAWVPVSQDMTEAFYPAPGFTNSRLVFVGQSNDTLITNYALDNVSLEICTVGGALMSIPLTVDGDARVADEGKAPPRYDVGALERAIDSAPGLLSVRKIGYNTDSYPTAGLPWRTLQDTRWSLLRRSWSR